MSHLSHHHRRIRTHRGRGLGNDFLPVMRGNNNVMFTHSQMTKSARTVGSRMNAALAYGAAEGRQENRELMAHHTPPNVGTSYNEDVRARTIQSQTSNDRKYQNLSAETGAIVPFTGSGFRKQNRRKKGGLSKYR